jgi:Flp pilus assembly protein TadD
LNRPQDGIASFDRALKIQPSFVAALQAASETAYRSRDSRAAGYLQKLLAVEPASEPAHAMAAVLAFESNDCGNAVAHFTKSASQVRGNDLASSQFGHCLLELGRPEEASRVFEQQMENAAANAHARYNLAVAQLQAGDAEKAIRTLAPLDESADSDALNLLASAEAAAGHTQEALTTLRRAVKMAPQDERNYLDLALLCQKSGAPGVAVEFLDAGLRRLPRSARLYATRGVLWAQLGELDKAEVDFERAGFLEPDEAYASAGLSTLFTETGRAEGAAALLRKKLAQAPDDPTLNCVLADALIREGIQPDQPGFSEARQALLRATRARPNFARAHATLGKLYLRENKTADAIRELELALRLDPANRPALNQLSVALRKVGRRTEADAVSERLRRQYERDLETEAARQRVRLAP